MKTEVEIRGPLQRRQHQDLLELLIKKGKLLKEADQLAIFFYVKKDNFSLKRDHDEEKIVLKFGNWEKGSRQEVEVLLHKEQFANALKLLKGLGFTKGYKTPARRQDFAYRGVQISLKTKAVIGPHFEMETTVNHRRDIKKAKEKLLKIAHDLGLRIWSEEEYRTHTNQRWQARHLGPQKL